MPPGKWRKNLKVNHGIAKAKAKTKAKDEAVVVAVPFLSA
jgi:hypothetical protein